MVRPIPVRLLGAAVLAALLVPLAAKSAGGVFRTVGRGLRKLGEDMEKAADEANAESVRRAAKSDAPESEATATKVTETTGAARRTSARRKPAAKRKGTTTRRATPRKPATGS